MTSDTLVRGALVTMDPARPRAEAMLVRDGCIAAVGTLAEVRAVFEPHCGADGAHFTRPMHVRVLCKL